VGAALNLVAGVIKNSQCFTVASVNDVRHPAGNVQTLYSKQCGVSAIVGRQGTHNIGLNVRGLKDYRSGAPLAINST